MYAEIWVVLSVKINNDRNKYSREDSGVIHEIQQPFGKKSKFVFHKEVSFLLFVWIFDVSGFWFSSACNNSAYLQLYLISFNHLICK